MITATLVSAPHGMDVNEHQDAHEISVVVDTTDPGVQISDPGISSHP